MVSVQYQTHLWSPFPQYQTSSGLSPQYQAHLWSPFPKYQTSDGLSPQYQAHLRSSLPQYQTCNGLSSLVSDSPMVFLSSVPDFQWSLSSSIRLTNGLPSLSTSGLPTSSNARLRWGLSSNRSNRFGKEKATTQSELPADKEHERQLRALVSTHERGGCTEGRSGSCCWGCCPVDLQCQGQCRAEINLILWSGLFWQDPNTLEC